MAPSPALASAKQPAARYSRLAPARIVDVKSLPRLLRSGARTAVPFRPRSPSAFAAAKQAAAASRVGRRSGVVAAPAPTSPRAAAPRAVQPGATASGLALQVGPSFPTVSMNQQVSWFNPSNDQLVTPPDTQVAPGPSSLVEMTNSSSVPAGTTAGGFHITAFKGMDSGIQTVATFTDPVGAEALGEYKATIAWGDQSTSTLNLAAGVLAFSTSHQSLNNLPGNASYPSAVTVTDSGLASTSASASVEVDNVAPSGLVLNLSQSSILEDGSTTLTGTFADPGSKDAHTVMNHWGDSSHFYTSDAADDPLCVHLGGRRIIKKKNLDIYILYTTLRYV